MGDLNPFKAPKIAQPPTPDEIEMKAREEAQKKARLLRERKVETVLSAQSENDPNKRRTVLGG